MTKIETLKKACYDLWRKIVRLNADGLCQLHFGGVEGEEAHHWAHTQGAGGIATDYMPENGIFLCGLCHRQAHNEPVKFWIKLNWRYGKKIEEAERLIETIKNNTLTASKNLTTFMVLTMTRERLKKQLQKAMIEFKERETWKQKNPEKNILNTF